ncbi:hypothetical protein FC093_00870 [Ilyomonas limi]|uniref:Uncharacterized protein n=1 Tax=Ilyomonas limi TaxID=2575867 RepID=A0A4U3LCJ6_9BACT|nr:hypothetical protein [Ilyomonas limi]TKK71607.1 hypothetical protein FC093_00870 [Ilyomonas limi]
MKGEIVGMNCTGRQAEAFMFWCCAGITPHPAHTLLSCHHPWFALYYTLMPVTFQSLPARTSV